MAQTTDDRCTQVSEQGLRCVYAPDHDGPHQYSRFEARQAAVPLSALNERDAFSMVPQQYRIKRPSYKGKRR